MRPCYRCLLWLHPPAFRREFGGEMLWIFDQAAESQGALPLVCDGLGSLARQWLLRSGWWKIAIAMALAMVEVIFGGLGVLLFGRRQVAGAGIDTIEFAHHGAIAHEPLTIGMVMYLAVFVTCGLLIMVIGLSIWLKTVSARRPAIHRVR